MNGILGRFEEYLYAIVRIVSGFLFACHGVQKLFGVLGGFQGTPDTTATTFSRDWIEGLIELVGGTLITLGLFTRGAALVCSIMMALAYFQFHHQLGAKIWPILNKGELTALYSLLFLYIAARGHGIWNLTRPAPRPPTSI